MSTLLGIFAAVALFVTFGLFRRGREPERGCGSCTGGDCGHCSLDDSVIPSTRSNDVRS